ncbi:MAG TPA: hypothetical protein VIM39_09405 [Candidatus Limnocylindrales bacterium]
MSMGDAVAGADGELTASVDVGVGAGDPVGVDDAAGSLVAVGSGDGGSEGEGKGVGLGVGVGVGSPRRTGATITQRRYHWDGPLVGNTELRLQPAV